MRRPSRGETAAAAAAAVTAALVATGLVLARQGDSGATGMDSGASSALQPAVTEMTRAPSLEGRDPVTGETVRLADFRGTPIVINVWASWCPGCNEEAEDLRAFAEAHPEAVVLGLDYQDTVAGAKDFYRKWGWRHPSIADAAGTKAAALGLVGLPTTYFLDARHRVVAQIVGATDRAGFERGFALATS